MFKVGEAYDFEIADCTDDDGQRDITTYPSRRVTRVDGPLVEIDNAGQLEIINTLSTFFVRATHRIPVVSSGRFAPRKPPTKKA